jgi:hypothetical protein
LAAQPWRRIWHRAIMADAALHHVPDGLVSLPKVALSAGATPGI